jgi:hypothetical protein
MGSRWRRNPRRSLLDSLDLDKPGKKLLRSVPLYILRSESLQMYLLKRHAHTIYEIHHAFLINPSSPPPAHLEEYHYKEGADPLSVHLPRD